MLATLYTITVDTRTAGPVTSLSQLHRFTALCRCEVYNLPHARTEVLVHGRSGVHVWYVALSQRPISFDLDRGVSAAWWQGALISCTSVGKGGEEPRGWVDAARWCSHRGGANARQTLATGTGLVRRVAGA